MAIAPTCFKMTIKDHSHGGQYAARQSERCYLRDHIIIPEGSRCIRSILSFDNLSRRRGKNASSFCQAVKKEDQIRALESYFSKLQDDAEDLQLRVDSSQEAEILPQNNQFESEKGLNSLEAYLDKVKGGNIILHWSLHGVVLLTEDILFLFHYRHELRKLCDAWHEGDGYKRRQFNGKSRVCNIWKVCCQF